MWKDKDITHNNESSESIIFLNTPIHDSSEDIIGFGAHVNSLCSAIDSGAQIIAVTSPFGAGKSSVAELLKLALHGKAKLINISMWSHLCNIDESDSTIDLHRNFLYQLTSKIDYKTGVYINRLLSPNYGILKLHTKNRFYSFLTFTSIVLFILGYVFPHVFEIGLPVFIGFGTPDMWNSFFILLSIICITIVIIYAEVVFSSNKSEGNRTIDTNEIFELYRNFISSSITTQNNSIIESICRNNPKNLNRCNAKKYVVVIEDLDRSSNPDKVITFLKELRKYYIQDASCKEPHIVFIVNVKPESSLFSTAAEHKLAENESLYAKLFDYILNIQTINIADYETILNAILKSKGDVIRKRLNYSGDKMTDIPGMQWIIRGKNLGLRDIKDRLNKAFNLYESLKSRFPSSQISFEKCAAVAYITTAFEQEFICTKDDAFGQLVEANLQKKLTTDYCKTEIKLEGGKYINEVISLVKSKIIDSNYRMYFYNYPRQSVIYTNDELIVQNAVLYDEFSEDLSDIVCRVVESNPNIVHNAFKRVEALKLPLPSTVLKIEALFTVALGYYPEMVYSWAKNLEYSGNSVDKTIQQFLQILKYDSSRTVISTRHIVSFCDIWEEKFGATNLLKLRKQLCENFRDEILMFSRLFKGVHSIITTEEMDMLDLDSAIQLINIENDSFDIKYVQYIISRFEDEFEDINSQPESQNVKKFLNDSVKIIKKSTISIELLHYMGVIKTIIPEFEEIIFSLLISPDFASDKSNELFSIYQNLINMVPDSVLSAQTFHIISSLKRYKGFSTNVADALIAGKYIFDGIIIRQLNYESVNYSDPCVVASIEENLSWLIEQPELFTLIRTSVLKTRDPSIIRMYQFLFSEACQIICTQELDELEAIDDVYLIINLIPAVLVTESQAVRLTNYFSKRFHANNTAFDILMFISSFDDEIAAESFNSLDFDNAIRYKSFSSEKKETIKNAFSTILDLGATAGKINFIEKTRCADESFDRAMSSHLKANASLQQKYAQALNKCDSKTITATSIDLLTSFDTIYVMNNAITEKYYNAGEYIRYVSSKTAYNKEFVVETGEKLEILWPVYMKIFSSSDYTRTRGYMAENKDFIKMIMDKKAYKGLPNENRKVLSSILQDEASIRNVIVYGERFALEYYSCIPGFCDEAAAKAFLDILETSTTLLKSDELYEHVHDKLFNSSQKSKYTRMRRKAAYR